MLVLNEKEVLSIIKSSFRGIIDVNRKALGLLGANKDLNYDINVPSRIGIPYKATAMNGNTMAPTDVTLFKPAMITRKGTGETSLGIKVVSVRDGNAKIGKPIVPASIMLLDAESGEVKAMMGGTYLTAARTAAGSACSTEIMCLPRIMNSYEKIHGVRKYRALELVCFGAGLQIELHIEALRHCRWPSSIDNPVKLSKLTIINRSKDRAELLREKILLQQSEYEDNGLASIGEVSVLLLDDVSEIHSALSAADIIFTATNTSNPLFDGKYIKSGAHICGVGSYTVRSNCMNLMFIMRGYNFANILGQSSMQEVDESLVKRCHVAFDTNEALRVGDLKSLINESHGILFADLISEEERNPAFYQLPHIFECSFFKSVGTAIQDILTADLIVNEAKLQNIGTSVDMT